MTAAIPLVVIGAAGFGRETLDMIDAVNAAGTRPRYEVLGVVDRGPGDLDRARLSARGIPLLGTEDEWLATDTDAEFVVGIGDPRIRQRLAATFAARGHAAATIVHPSAILGSQLVVGAGSVIGPGVTVGTNVTLGEHVHLNPHATIGHDSVLHDFVSINPAATISGFVDVGELTLVGASAVVLYGLQVGVGATVGAAACVVRDVPPQTIVKGVPAR